MGFKRIVFNRLTRALATGGLLPLFSSAQTASVRVPLSMATVVQALHSAGVEANESQIKLPFRVETSSADPILVVTGAEVLPEARLRVRLACSEPHDCLPFFATLQCSDDNAAETDQLSLSRSSFIPRQPIRNAVIPALRAGDHAMLLLEDKQMEITLPVLSIDSGKVGSTVRVSSLDRKRTFLATIVSAQVVRGTLP